jgi:Polyketide cyclase / dehydrase and lipid transport
MGTLKRSGRVETVTDATPEQVWAVVADVTRVGEWSHECGGAMWVEGATSARAGARFSGANRVGRVKWSRVNEIVCVDAPRELAWRTVPTRLYPDSTEWRIRIEPEDGKTRIVQTFDVLKLNPVMDRLIYLVTPAHRDRLPALADDVRRLGEVAAQQPPVPVS